MPDQLQTGFDTFVNWQTGLFCLGVYFITYVFRTVVESIWPGVKKRPSWTELTLHCSPIVLGSLLALFAKDFPWPLPVANSMWVKLFYGSVCGGASGFVYGRFMAWLAVAANSQSPTAQAVTQAAEKLGVKPNKNSSPPPAPKPESEETKTEA